MFAARRTRRKPGIVVVDVDERTGREGSHFRRPPAAQHLRRRRRAAARGGGGTGVSCRRHGAASAA
jgi:hypothetical protein